MEAWCCIAWRLTGPSLLLWGRGVTGGNFPNAAVLTLFSLGPVVTENAIENSRVSNSREGEVRHGSEADVPPMK